MPNTNPSWLKKRLVSADRALRTQEILSCLNVRTICQSGRCPNLNECFSKGTATFAILGDVCTRTCVYCSVKKGNPEELKSDEPYRVREAIKLLGLSYAVITSVTRDDLGDGGAGQFVKVIDALNGLPEKVKIEVLVPDFGGNERSLYRVLSARPDVFSHNIETVRRLYPLIRPKAEYDLSLEILRKAKSFFPGQLTKSGIMVGLGEDDDEILQTIRDIRSRGCDMLTIGQYLRPTAANLPVSRYALIETFDRFRATAMLEGFKYVASGPFVRSSYLAEEGYDFIKRRKGVTDDRC